MPGPYGPPAPAAEAGGPGRETCVPALRLINGGGSSHRGTGHYRDDIVVYLVAVPS